MKQVLLIFAKNLVYGEVKTRLAATAGDPMAFDVYKELLEYTFRITRSLAPDKIIFYSGYIDQADTWSSEFKKQIQKGKDLGERIHHAFDHAFTNGYKEVVIIGTDCFELTPAIITEAFSGLKDHDVVIGPANDGGYYLLGMKKMNPGLLQNISWSTEKVLSQTTSFCNDNKLSVLLLEELSDLDNEKDLEKMLSGNSKKM